MDRECETGTGSGQEVRDGDGEWTGSVRRGWGVRDGDGEWTGSERRGRGV